MQKLKKVVLNEREMGREREREREREGGRKKEGVRERERESLCSLMRKGQF